MDNVAVIISVYHSDTLKNFKKSIESIYVQKCVNVSVYLAVDGKVDSEIHSYIEALAIEHNTMHILWGERSLGLATRLNQLIDSTLEANKFDFIARMDSDDISDEYRLIKQVNYLKENPDVSILGSDIIEIDEDDNILFYKKMYSSHKELKENIIKRCPFNHPTVMFRSSVFTSGHRYIDSLKNTQDYYLWVDLLNYGFKFANINEPLLMFRVNDDFHKRRGIKKAVIELKSRFYALKKLNVWSLGNILHPFMLFFLRLSPSTIKKVVYARFRNN